MTSNIISGLISGILLLVIEHYFFRPKSQHLENPIKGKVEPKPNEISQPAPSNTSNATSSSSPKVTVESTSLKNKNVYVAMVLSLLFGGGGQIYLGQVSKGLLLIFGAIISQLSFVGIGFPILCVVDAYIMTKKLNNGNNIGEWEFGLNWRVFLIAVGTIIIFLFLGTINL